VSLLRFAARPIRASRDDTTPVNLRRAPDRPDRSVRAFDRNSHSASDTLRPFLLTMAPVWALAILAARALTRR
jgi:hypothetical protein